MDRGEGKDKRIRVRYLFIGLFFFLPLQYLIVGAVSYIDQEPWPAFVMPGFKTVHMENRKYTVPKTEFILKSAEGDTLQTLRPHEFFTGIPRSQVLGVIDQLMVDEERISRLTPETLNWMQQNGEALAGEPVGSILIRKRILYYSRKAEALELDIDSVAYRFTKKISFEEDG